MAEKKMVGIKTAKEVAVWVDRYNVTLAFWDGEEGKSAFYNRPLVSLNRISDYIAKTERSECYVVRPFLAGFGFVVEKLPELRETRETQELQEVKAK